MQLIGYTMYEIEPSLLMRMSNRSNAHLEILNTTAYMPQDSDEGTTEPKIVNVVITADLAQALDLHELAASELVFHDEAVYGGRVGYFRSPSFHGEVTLFPSGKMIGVGSKSVIEAVNQLELTKDTLVKEGVIEPHELYPKVQNIVATAYLGQKLDLEKLALELDVDFEPEQFPGAIIRLRELPGVTVLAFSSGKAVVTGARTKKDIEKALEMLESNVRSYSK